MATFSFFGKSKYAQNEAHLRNLILMAKSDNSIDQSELEVIYKIGIHRNFTENEIKDLLRSNDRQKLIVPENDQDKFEQLYDLTLVMMADGVIEDDEMNFCINFGNKLGLRKTNAALLITEIIEGLEDKYDKFDIFNKTKKHIS
jgi:uncharacterized membrane protein YebE (DUF533 family)